MRGLAARAAASRPAPIGLLGTAALHGVLIAAFVISAREVKHSPLPAYAVELIAAPRATTEAEAADASAAPARAPAPAPAPARPPESTRAAPPPAKAPPPTPSKATAPVRTPPAATARAPATEPARPSARPSAEPATPGAAKAAPGAAAVSSPNTNAAPGTGTAPATIRTVGVEFPFEGYLRNLVAQVYRRWHPPSGNADLESEMLFLVHRDGSVTGLYFTKRSGSFAFDLEAQGAVEAASRAGSFGPLPSGFAPDVLPVSFFFSPRSLR
ncbi:MAG: TonB C-terminal domain-containing protein [Gemmatimonadales bacterium]